MTKGSRYFLMIAIAADCCFSCSRKMYLDDWGLERDGRSKAELREFDVAISGDTVRKGKLTNKFTIFYNDFGAPTELWESGSDEYSVKIKDKFTYDKDARTITFSAFLQDTIRTHYTVTSFDKKMRVMSRHSFDRSGTMTSYFVNVLEPNGRDYYTFQYNQQNELEHKSFTQNNKRRQPTKIISYNAKGTVSSFCTLKYDRKGREIETLFFDHAGRLTSGSKNIRYNSKNEQIYQESLGFSGKADAKIKRQILRTRNTKYIVTYKDGKPTGIEEITITY